MGHGSGCFRLIVGLCAGPPKHNDHYVAILCDNLHPLIGRACYNMMVYSSEIMPVVIGPKLPRINLRLLLKVCDECCVANTFAQHETNRKFMECCDGFYL